MSQPFVATLVLCVCYATCYFMRVPISTVEASHWLVDEVVITNYNLVEKAMQMDASQKLHICHMHYVWMWMCYSAELERSNYFH